MACVLLYLDTARSWCLVVLSFCVLAARSLPQVDRGPQEFCQTEVFEATCTQQDQIIYIEQALYGRMQLGKCVQTDYGHVGCQADVLRETDRRCSGKRICRITIPDAEFDLMHNCPPEFKTYFQVSFTCLKITVPELPVSCNENVNIPVTEPSGYLASVITSDKRFGSASCPWRIQMPRGQRINMTLIDFSTPEYNVGDSRASRGHQYDVMTSSRGSSCKTRYATLTEPLLGEGSSPRTRVCGGTQRIKHILLSRSHIIDVRIMTNHYAHFGDENFFALKYEAVGCPTPDPPPYGWVERLDDGALLGCNYTTFTWRWICDGMTWKGPHHNCTSEGPSHPSRIKWGTFSLPYSVSVGVIIGLAIIVGVIILLVGLICMEWRKMRRCEKAELMAQNMKLHHPPDLLERDDHYQQHNGKYVNETLCINKDCIDITKDTDYTYVREMWPLAPPAPCNVNGQNMFNAEREASQNEKRPESPEYSPVGAITPSTCSLKDDRDRHVYETCTGLLHMQDTVNSVPKGSGTDSKVPTEKDAIISVNFDDDTSRYKPCLV